MLISTFCQSSVFLNHDGENSLLLVKFACRRFYISPTNKYSPRFRAFRELIYAPHKVPIICTSMDSRGTRDHETELKSPIEATGCIFHEAWYTQELMTPITISFLGIIGPQVSTSARLVFHLIPALYKVLFPAP